MPPALLEEIADELQDAFHSFESILTPSDVNQFRSTSLEDVYEAVGVVERERDQRKRLVNLRRIKSLLDRLKPLENVLQAVCPAEHHLSYIWAPIKYMLEVADASDAHLKKLLSAYTLLSSQLLYCETLTEYDHLEVYGSGVAAYVVIDVLDFHRRLYQILRRGGWSILFEPAWKHFLHHVDHMSRRLKLCKDTAAENLDDDKWTIFCLEWNKLRGQQTREEEERNDLQYRACVSWLELNTQEQEQESLFERRAEAREAATCDWILTHPKLRSWLDPDHSRPVLWLKGKPGSGKTTLTTFITVHAEIPPESLMLYCLCTRTMVEAQVDPCLFALRVMVTQILRRRPLLVPFVYEYVRNVELPSIRTIPNLLRSLLLCLPSSYIIVDGLDECDPEQQKHMLAKLDILLLLRKDEIPTRPEVKILICSRETKATPARLKNEPTISLTKEDEHVSRDIRTYTRNNIQVLYDRFEASIVDKLADDIVNKANGMFLWVQLVLSVLCEQLSLRDLQTTVKELPASLTGVYIAIMRRLEEATDDRDRRRVRSIFNWLSFSRRPLKVWELCDTLVFDEPGQHLDQNTVLGKDVINICKPLIEEHADGAVAFVHFSAKEFLLHRASGPFIDQWKAEQAISVTCFRYLRTCEEFFHNSRSACSYGQIVQCQHNLFAYVNDFWRAHLAACLATYPPTEQQHARRHYGDVVVHNGTLIQGDQYYINVASEHQLGDHMDRCLANLGLLQTATGVTEARATHPPDLDWLIENAFTDKKDCRDQAEIQMCVSPRMPRSDCLLLPQSFVSANQYQTPRIDETGISAPRTAVSELLVETVKTTWSLLQQTVDSHNTSTTIDGPVSEAYSHFQEQLENLVGAKCPFSCEDMNVSKQEMDGFLVRYATSAYACRWKHCSRFNLGFSNSADRDKHEELHKQQFCCPETGCDFAENGFTSRTALKTHLKRYHTQHSAIPIPELRLRNSKSKDQRTLDREYKGSSNMVPTDHDTASLPLYFSDTRKREYDMWDALGEPVPRPKSGRSGILTRKLPDHTVASSPQIIPLSSSTATQISTVRSREYEAAAPQKQDTKEVHETSEQTMILRAIYSYLTHNPSGPTLPDDWRTGYSMQERTARVLKLFYQLRSCISVPSQKLLKATLLFEAKQFKQCATMLAYEQNLTQRHEQTYQTYLRRKAQPQPSQAQQLVDTGAVVEPTVEETQHIDLAAAWVRQCDDHMQSTEQLLLPEFNDYDFEGTFRSSNLNHYLVELNNVNSQSTNEPKPLHMSSRLLPQQEHSLELQHQTNIPQTSPLPQAQTSQLANLIRPDQVSRLPHLNPQQKQQTEVQVQKYWDFIHANTNNQGDPRYHQAQQALAQLSSKLMAGIKAFKVQRIHQSNHSSTQERRFDSIEPNAAQSSWTNFGARFEEFRRQHGEELARFYDHFETAAEETFPAHTQSSVCLEFLTDIWHILKPENRDLLLRDDRLRNDLACRSKWDVLKGIHLGNQRMLLIRGINTYTWFCEQLHPVMCTRPDLWHDSVESNISKMWRRLTKGQRRCLHIAANQSNTLMANVFTDKKYDKTLYDDTMSNLKALAAGIDLRFSGDTFRQRFELSRLFVYGLDPQHKVLQDQYMVNKGRLGIYSRLLNMKATASFGEETFTRLVNIIWHLLDLDERSVLTEGARVDSDVFTTISAGTILRSLEDCFAGKWIEKWQRVGNHVTREEEDRAFRMLFGWLYPRLEMTNTHYIHSLAFRMRKCIDVEWSLLRPSLKRILADLALSNPDVVASVPSEVTIEASKNLGS